MADGRNDSHSSSDDSTESSVPPTPSKVKPQTPTKDGSKLESPKPKTRQAAEIPIVKKKSKLKKRKRSREGVEKKHENSPKEEAAGNVVVEPDQKVLFQRIWSDEDEIALLKGMIGYKTEKGVLPTANSKDFYDFVKDDLQNKADHIQVRNKMRKLREKFNNLLAKKYLDGHEQEVMKLGMQIWGDQRPNKGKQVESDAGEVDLQGGIGDDVLTYMVKASPWMNLDESMVRSALRMCDEDKLAEIVEKWRMLGAEEAKLNSRKMGMSGELMGMVAAVFR